MGQNFRLVGTTAAVLGLILGAGAAQAHPSPLNRSVESVHQPVVDRTDFVLDVATSPAGLAPGEVDRLSGWFDALRLGYGDTIRIDDPRGWRGGSAQDTIAAVVSHYGMLVSHDTPPVTAGRAADGALRVIVSRAVAHIEGCPDWSRGNAGEYAGASKSNFGCADATNLAAMIANPQDLIEGRSGDTASDAKLSVKAIKTYRDAVPTGMGGLKSESSTSGGK